MTPLGLGVDTYWSGVKEGRSGVRLIQNFDASDLAIKIAGEVPDFVAKDHMDAKAARRMDRFSQFGVAAAREALANANFTIDDSNREQVGVMVNTGGGGIWTIEQNVITMREHGPGRVSPFLIPLFSPNMASSQVSITFGVRGPTVTSVAACAAGVQAFVDAVHLLQRGEADVVITGGTEAAMTPVALSSLANMGALSKRNDDPTRASRPFDADRDGFIYGEGAGIAILETEEHAVRRGASVLCRVSGGAYTSDAFHLTAPDPGGSGAALAMKRAMVRAEIAPEQVDYVAAHATSTIIGDRSETKAIKQAFGSHAPRLAVSANKSMLGHLLGAAGAVSAISCILAIRDGIVPPTINLETPDPECDLDYVPNVARRMPVRVAIANGFGFGGQNACAVFEAV